MINSATKSNHKPRIGIDIRTLMDSYYSGVPAYTYRLVDEIIRQDRDSQYVLFYNAAQDMSGRIPDFRYANAEVVSTRYPNKIFNYLLQKTLGRPKLDSLLRTDLFFMPHLNFAALERADRSLVAVHDLSFLRFPEFFSLRKTIWHTALQVKRSLKRFRYVIAVSQNTKKDLLDLVGLPEERVVVIHSGLPENCYPWDKNDKRLDQVRAKFHLPREFVLYLGTLEPRKNVRGTIQAFEECCERGLVGKDCYLVLAGARGWKYESIFRAWRASPFRDRIIFTGFVAEEEKIAFYNLAKIFVYPSFYEGFGFPPLEAMRCGTPVITANSSSLPEVVAQGGILVNPFDAGETAAALSQLYHNKELREKMVELGFIAAQNYTWSRTACQYLDLFKQNIF